VRAVPCCAALCRSVCVSCTVFWSDLSKCPEGSRTYSLGPQCVQYQLSALTHVSCMLTQ
jgi:hypothetical protein